MPFILIAVAMALTYLAYSTYPPVSPSPASDKVAYNAATTMADVHQAALAYARANPSASGLIPLSGATSLASFLPPDWSSVNGLVILTCIGSTSEHRAVATWTTAGAPPASRVARALAALYANDSSAGLVGVNASQASLVVPPSATPTHSFPVATCGSLPPSPLAVLVTPTLP